jgi:NitT/TauT family transport system ATP-binding protein
VAQAQLQNTLSSVGGTSTKLTAHGVCMHFEREGQRSTVLDNVDLSVQEGELLCLLGPSGCGKSTLLNLFGGFLSPSAGEVRIDKQVVSGPSRKTIFVFQERGVFPWLTVSGNIGFGLFELTRSDREERVRHYVKLVGLQGFERAYPHELSGGMKQRLEVARAFAVNPDMLLLDEPFGALDSITRMTMRSELLRIWEAERKTIIFVTHDIDEAIQLADRVVVLGGRPATVQSIAEVDLPHPRDISAPRYLALRRAIYDAIGLAHRV